MATIDERLEALTMNLESTASSLEETRRIVNLLAESQVKTEEMVNKLFYIAQNYNRRLDVLEGR